MLAGITCRWLWRGGGQPNVLIDMKRQHPRTEIEETLSGGEAKYPQTSALLLCLSALRITHYACAPAFVFVFVSSGCKDD